MWNLSFDGLLNQFSETGPVPICGFADDVCLVTSAWSDDSAVRKMQAAVDKAIAWGRNHGLSFSPRKTIAMFFSLKKDHEPPETTISVNGRPIDYSTEVKYLGVHLDSQLNWNLHFAKKLGNAKRLLFQMRNAVGITWGPRPHLIRWIFTGIVCPALTYGSVVWAHSIEYKHQTTKLKRLHSLITRLLAPKRKSTLIAGMEMIAYIPPLDIYLKGEAIKSYIRNHVSLPHNWDGKSS